MTGRTSPDGPRVVAALLVVVVVGASLQGAGLAYAATNVSISPDNPDANATGVTYNASGDLQLGDQDTLQYVDVHLAPADVSAVGSGDIAVYIDGVEYTDGFTEFSASGGTVEFKLSNSQSVSDGDTVRIEVADVTNPEDDFTANATLHDTGDAQFQEFEDTVSINTPAQVSYENLTFTDTRTDGNDTTVEIGEDLTVSAVVNNTGEQSGTYNASLEVDGSVVQWENGTVDASSTTTVEFITNFTDAGAYDVTVADLAAQEVTVVGSTEIVDGAADPDPVDAGRTVDNQLVYIEVANVSQDGDTDTHYVEFPDELANSLSPNSADANATSVTSSVNLVDGFDGDGVDDTIRFSTSGDGGGAIDLNLTVDTGVTYPDREDAFEIDARTVDSSGETTTQRDVETINTDANATISAYDASNPDGRELAVSFNSTETLTDITINATNASGETVATFTEADLTETNESGTWVYNGSQILDADGSYDVTLEQAVDDDGNDVADGETDTVQIDTQGVAIVDGAADPASVDPGRTVNNQLVTVTLADVSADGNTDTHYVEFPDALADGLSVSSASVNGSASIAQSAELVDGFDGDGVDDTVRFQTDDDSGGTVGLNVTVDVSVDYPDAESVYGIDARVEDSDQGSAQVSNVTTVSTVTVPRITDYGVANPEDRNVSVSFNASEELADVAIEVTDSSGDTVATLTEGDLSERNASGTWVYDGAVTVPDGDDYTATLTTAADADGNDGADGQSGTVSIGTSSVVIVDGSASPEPVSPGTTVDNQEVFVVVDGVSADGDTDVHFIEFPNDLAEGLQPNSANANATSITSSVNLVDGFDGDGVDDTLRFATSAEGGGTVALNLSVDTGVDYPDEEAIHWIDARVEDSDGGTTTEENVTRIRAGTPPSITDVSVTNPDARNIDVTFESSEQLSTITVPLTDDSGTTVATLTESEFSGTNDGGTWTYSATTSVENDGEYTGTVTEARDDIGLDGAEDESDSTQVSTDDSTDDSDNTDDSTDDSDNTDDSTDDSDNTDDSTGDSDNTDDSTDDSDGASRPMVSDFDVAIDGQDVDVVVTVDTRVDELAVGLTGAEIDSLSIENFTRAREDGRYVYSADVDSDNGSTVVGTLRRVADDGGSVTPDRVASANPGPRPNSFGASPYAGADESRHTFAVRIAENASVTGQPLDRLAVSYSEAFRAAGGDLSSVSDDGNVEWLLVVAEDGSVRSRLGDTDEVTVDTTAGSVALDLSTVDSERRPTIRAGDRIVVGLESVGNPRSADRYNATVTLQSVEGPTHDLATSVRIWNSSTVEAVDVGVALPNGEQATAELEAAPTLTSAAVESRESAVGPVQAIAFDDRPAVSEDLSRPVVATMRLDRPVFAEDAEATLRVTLPLAELDTSAANHTIARYDEETGEWHRLDTTVAERGNGTVTLRATTNSTSSFAVLASESGASDNTEPTATEPASTGPSDDETDDPERSSVVAGPLWWVLGLLLLALILAALAAARRQE